MIKKIQQKLLALFFFLTDSDYRKIKNSGIFNPEFYLDANPDVAKGGKHPLLHYFREGWREGRSPNLLFDVDYYLNQLTDGEKARQVEPILHFITEGWRQGKKPSPYFDPQYYAAKDNDLAQINPLSHFILRGSREGQYRHPYFNLHYYTQKYTDVAISDMDPLAHYIQVGRKENRQPGLFFDISWYVDRTPILHDVTATILLHHDKYGIQEGKSPVPVFDPAFYAATNSDTLKAGEDPLLHYLAIGERYGRRPCPWFDPIFYRQTYLGEDAPSSLGHYLLEGVWRGNYGNSDIAKYPEKPVFSIIIPVYNVKSHHLNNCLRSVLYQSYPHWQICLADDCSSLPHVRPLLENWAAHDSRIKVTFLEKNLGIAGATNAAAALATGDFLGFLDNDDELAPDCLSTITRKIFETRADLLYTDEDLIGEDGRRFSCFYKPDYNPELLLSHNYVTHFVVTAKALFLETGGLDVERAGAQDYDLFIKLSEKANKIVHLPKVLYHWRASESSTSINHEQKEYADEAGRLSLVDALARRDIEGEVLPTEWKFYYRVKRELSLLPLVSLVVYWDQEDQEPSAWFGQLIETTAYKNYEVIFLHDGGCDTEPLRAYLASIDQPTRLVKVAGHLGITAMYDMAVQYCDGDYLCFISSDVVISDAMWLSALLEYCQVTDTGAVSGRMDCIKPDLVEITPIPDIDNQSAWYYARYLQQASILMNGLHCPQNSWSFDWQCCLINKEALTQCGGFAVGEFPELFAPHDLSFRLCEWDWQIYYTPYCRMDWRADARRFSEKRRHDSWLDERQTFQKKWRSILSRGNPYFNRGILDDTPISSDEFQSWFVGPA